LAIARRRHARTRFQWRPSGIVLTGRRATWSTGRQRAAPSWWAHNPLQEQSARGRAASCLALASRVPHPSYRNLTRPSGQPRSQLWRTNRQRARPAITSRRHHSLAPWPRRRIADRVVPPSRRSTGAIPGRRLASIAAGARHGGTFSGEWAISPSTNNPTGNKTFSPTFFLSERVLPHHPTRKASFPPRDYLPIPRPVCSP